MMAPGKSNAGPTSICSSRSSGALAGEVGRNPLLATFVLSGNPLENLQVVFVFVFTPGMP